MEETYSIKKVIIYVIVILIIFGAFYGITVLLTENKKQKESTNDEPYVAIQYEEIIVGNIFKQKENEYYVLATTSLDSNSETYNTNFKKYATSENAIKSYTIDLDSGFNKKYIAGESNFNGELPIFKTSTLIKIVDKKIVETYEGENITSILETLNNK